MVGETNPDLRAVLGAATSDNCPVSLRKPSDFVRALPLVVSPPAPMSSRWRLRVIVTSGSEGLGLACVVEFLAR